MTVRVSLIWNFVIRLVAFIVAAIVAADTVVVAVIVEVVCLRLSIVVSSIILIRIYIHRVVLSTHLLLICWHLWDPFEGVLRHRIWDLGRILGKAIRINILAPRNLVLVGTHIRTCCTLLNIVNILLSIRPIRLKLISTILFAEIHLLKIRHVPMSDQASEL